MKWRAILVWPTAVMVLATIFPYLVRVQAEQKTPRGQSQAVQTLQQYIMLRLQDADWKEYSMFVTWPDEPSWDCRWVSSKYKISAPVAKGQEVMIPVVYSRLGLFCVEFDFTPNLEVVKIDYELIRGQSIWKVNAPIPDYPDISSDVLINSLNATAANASDTKDRRAAAGATARKITEALKQQTTTILKRQPH